MKTLFFDAEARAQIAAIFSRIAADNPFAAIKVLERIEAVAEMLAEFPDMGHRLRRRPERMMVVSPYRYVIIYRLMDDELHILQVRHTSRRRPMLQEAAAEFRR